MENSDTVNLKLTIDQARVLVVLLGRVADVENPTEAMKLAKEVYELLQYEGVEGIDNLDIIAISQNPAIVLE